MKENQKAVSFVPTKLLQWIADGITERRFQAVVAFADVSGFTAMSEKLATIGREGAEALTGILNTYFTEMISRIEEGGGFVGKFGGDAMTIFFPVEDGEELCQVGQRAVTISLDLQKKMADFQDVVTKAGKFSLGMKIGIASGNVLFKVVGPDVDGGKEFLLAGIPLDRAAEAEHHGVSGQVVVSQKLTKSCNLEGSTLDDGFLLLDAEQKCPVEAILSDPDFFNQDWLNISKYFIDPAVYKRMELGIGSVGEIRRVSVIFMSFTGLDYDVDSTVGEKLEVVYEWVYGLTRRYGGSINKVDMGDKGSKLIITFGTPTAHENDEELAVHCGLELVRGNDKLREMGVEQRLGIASGVVFAGEVGAPCRQEYTVMGSVVNLSARLMAKSKPGQLLVDPATHERAQKPFMFSEPQMMKFKGIKEPMPTYSVIGLKDKSKPVVSGKRLPFVGRQNEMEIIRSQIARVIAGKMSVLVVRGEPGVGKSRLAQESLNHAVANGFKTSGGEALSYAKRSPYLIWISILRRLIGLPSAGSGKEALKQLETVVKESDAEHVYRLPIVAGVLGIQCGENSITQHFDAQLRQENLFDFVVEYLRFLSQSQPILFLFEDSQWIDRNSLALITYVIRNLLDSPILILFVRRPYNQKFKSDYIPKIEQSSASVDIGLSELNREETEALVLQNLGVDRINQGLMDFIYDASHGNASFAEQLLENLKSLERIKIIPDSEGEGRVAEQESDLSDVEVPDSLSSLIMSQLDRLQPVPKLTVKLAAAVGRQFQEEIVTGSYPVEMETADIIKSIKNLETHDIIQTAADADLYNYIFKNLLTLEVAYDSLLFAHRREYHRRIGSCLEALYPETLNEWYEDLARHFAQSDDDDRAVKYLWKAGDKALDLFANEAAENYYTQAVDRSPVEKDPATRFKLLSMRSKVFAIEGKNELQKHDLDELLEIAGTLDDNNGKVNTLGTLARYFYRAHDLSEMKRVIDQAQEILETIDYPFGRFNINDKIAIWHFVQNKHEEALKYWQTCMQDAEEMKDKKGMSVALTNCGLAYKALGDYDQALEFYNRSVKIDREISNIKSEAVNLGNIGVLYHQRGEYEKALEVYQEALSIAKSIGSKQIQSYYLGNLAMIYQAKGERDRALVSHKELLELSTTIGFHRSQVASLINIGTWYIEFGDFDKAIDYLQQALEIARTHGLRGQEPQVAVNMGLALHYQGNLARAREVLEGAVQVSVDVKNKPSEDYARRYLGFVLFDQGEIDAADELFKQAIENAKSIGSKSSVASAKVGLGIVNLSRNDDRTLVDEGIAEAKELKDSETLIKGKVMLAKALLEKDKNSSEAISLLNRAMKVAETAGYRNDIQVIETLLKGREQ